MEDIIHSSVIKELNENGWVLSKPVGKSMYPMLRYCKDPIVIEKPKRPFKVNDVPVYMKGKDRHFVMHRIIGIKNGRYIIRGDNCIYSEYEITDDDIVGILTGFYRGDKFIDCEKNRLYKVYIVLNRVSYPLRLAWYRFKRVGSKVKRLLKKMFGVRQKNEK